MSEWMPIITAFAALAGVAVTQWANTFHANKDREYKRKVLLREKYEEMAKHLLDSKRQLSDVLLAKNREELQDLVLDSGGNNCALLCLLYFPELQENAAKYVGARVNLLRVLETCSYNYRDERPISEQAGGNFDFINAREAYHNAAEEFVSAIKTHSITYAVT